MYFATTNLLRTIMNNINPLFLTDAYKLGHADQYPDGTELVYSNFTPRSGKHSPIPTKFDDKKVVVFGLSGVLQELVDTWDSGFFLQPKEQVVAEFVEEIQPFVGPSGFNKSRVESLHDLGYLPIEVRSLPEGSKTNFKIPHFTIMNTKPEFFWLTNYLETVLSTELWKPSTVATIASAYRRILNKYAEETGTDSAFVDFQAHDFSSRGLSGYHDNMKVGAAHLTSFKGTDTLATLPYLNKYYFGAYTFKGASVPATEHSTMAMGEKPNELLTFKRLITEVYPEGVVAIVSDTWDFWKVITEYSASLKDTILSRAPDTLGMSKVVFRPDSGVPEDILCGTAIPVSNRKEMERLVLGTISEDNYGYYVIDGKFFQVYKHRGKESFITKTIQLATEDVTPEMKGAVECLWEIFGGTTTTTGHKLLDSHVGLIYGDSITLTRADTILSRLSAKGFASGNVVLGIGSYSYQHITRDTFGFAMKATYGEVNSVPRNIFKAPKTDNGTKHSAKGLLRVDKIDSTFVLTDQVTLDESKKGELDLLFMDNAFYNLPTLEQIRTRLNNKE